MNEGAIFMRLLKNVICLAILMVFSLIHASVSFAADSEWYWISSDDKYSKFFSMTRITTVSSQNNIPTCIEDWIKTGYAPGGAAEAISNMKLPIDDPNKLSYSLARIQINPQERTLRYMEEIFYDKDGTALYTLKYSNPIVKDINSQSFDEKFYAMIVDRVFNKGEGGRLISKDRWLTLWDNSSGDSAADTATMRQVGNDIYTWIWQENKDNAGNVSSIQFMKKQYNTKSLTANTLKYHFWSAQTGWEDRTSSVTGTHSIVPESTEDVEFGKIKSYAANNPSWVFRYQLNNPTTVTQNPTTATTTTTAPTTTPSTTTSTNTTTTPAVTSPAATDVANPIGSVGPIGAPINN